METGLCSRELLPYPAPTGITTGGKMSQQLSDFAPTSSPDLQQPQGREPASLNQGSDAGAQTRHHAFREPFYRVTGA